MNSHQAQGEVIDGRLTRRGQMRPVVLGLMLGRMPTTDQSVGRHHRDEYSTHVFDIQLATFWWRKGSLTAGSASRVATDSPPWIKRREFEE